jgi:hypothetical protein
MTLNSKIVLLAFVIGTLSSCSKTIAPQQGLVGEYLFEGNANDNSSYRNHGQVEGAVLTKGHGRKPGGAAYAFNGLDQFITIPHAAQTNFTYGQDFSISLWVKIDSAQTEEAAMNDIIRKWRGDTQGYPFAIVYYNERASEDIRNRFSFVRYDGSICRHAPQGFSKPTRKGKKFIHLVFVKQRESMKIYCNNKLESETKDTTLSESQCGSHNDSDITIGARANKVRFLKGAVDDVRFYNRALSKKEIAVLFRI